MSTRDQEAQSGASIEADDGSGKPRQAPGTVPMAQRGALYTMTAREGVNAAEIVNAALAKKQIGTKTPRRVEVAAPDGPSTDGGKRARQTIKLVPLNGGTGQVMCGFLDVGQKTVELRNYNTVLAQFKERFGVGLDFTADEYAALLKDLETTFGIFKYAVSIEAPGAAAPAAGTGGGAKPAAQQAASRPMRAQIAAKEEVEERSPIVSILLITLAVITLVGVGAAIFLR